MTGQPENRPGNVRVLIANAEAGLLQVRGTAHHYLVHVHRVHSGDCLEVFDGRGRAFTATVRSEEPLELELGPPREGTKLRAVTVLQGMPKGDKLELVIQKASELQATAVQPVFCERSVVKSSSNEARKLARWQKIADEAARQCGRSEVLRVVSPVPLAQAIAQTQGHLVVLDELGPARTLSQVVRALPADAALRLVVGPEGGLSDAERALLERHAGVSVTLGALVLRTETAALAALAVVRHLDGVLG
jgi:16S rRNA (uracil1498-N3)-methyltransferase